MLDPFSGPQFLSRQLEKANFFAAESSQRMQRERLSTFVGLIATALLALALPPLGGRQGGTITDLHAGDVPVQPLVHHISDPVTAYPEKFPMQVAVYWTMPNESVLEVEHALSQMGVPFFVTRDLNQALGHNLVLLYPSLDGRTFSDGQIAQLTRFVEAGGNLLGVNIFAGAAKRLFGFRDYTASRRRFRVAFTPNADPAERYLNRPEELGTRLGDPKYGDIFWTNGYAADPSATVLARFEDGSAAVLRNSVGKGSAYLLGLSLQDVVLRDQVNRDYDAERYYVNRFEPGADVWLLFLRAWYESRESGAVRLGSIPDGRASVLLLSHDVDWENSFAPALEFAQMEEEHGALSTFFIQTKYVSDYNSKSFFYGSDLDYLKQLFIQGFSIGSHSIIHSRGFNKFDLGSGSETYANYRPSGTGFDTARGATVFGEVRVSKELLNGELSGQRTIFFRAGHLRVPPSLPEALQRTGYEFDSSFTADDVLTNFPYSLPLGLGFDEDSGLYEFPVTFEDEEKPPLLERVDSALDVIRANAENGAMNVLLIHPNLAGDKLAAERQLLERLPGDVIATDMQSYALFWRARDRLRWTATPGESASEVVLHVTADEPVAGITFEFQREIASADSSATVLGTKHAIVLPKLRAGEQITIHLSYSR
jgi:hypothetical protein